MRPIASRILLVREYRPHRGVEVERGRHKADRVISGGKLVNVVTGEVYGADVAFLGATIIEVGDVGGSVGPNTHTFDARGKFLVPGLIDGHIHCEVTKLSMRMFAGLVVPHGTTSIVTAFDQIAGIAGLRGIREFLKDASRTPLSASRPSSD